jgi:hypothetical protein
MTRTAQEIFDTVVAHLRKQGCKSLSYDGRTCQYRGEAGRMCAAGCLIPDDMYTPDLECKTWSHIELKAIREHVGEEHTRLIEDLQMVHDGTHPDAWENRFHDVAQTHMLAYR